MGHKVLRASPLSTGPARLDGSLYRLCAGVRMACRPPPPQPRKHTHDLLRASSHSSLYPKKSQKLPVEGSYQENTRWEKVPNVKGSREPL